MRQVLVTSFHLVRGAKTILRNHFTNNIYLYFDVRISSWCRTIVWRLLLTMDSLKGSLKRLLSWIWTVVDDFNDQKTSCWSYSEFLGYKCINWFISGIYTFLYTCSVTMPIVKSTTQILFNSIYMSNCKKSSLKHFPVGKELRCRARPYSRVNNMPRDHF